MQKHGIDSLQALRHSRAYRLGRQLKQLHVGLTAVIEDRLRADGMHLTRPQALTLMLLAEQPGASNAELARLGAVSPQTMHQILLRLHRDGLVSRRSHPSRARALSFEITATGLEKLTRGAALAQTVIETAFDPLSPAEQDQLTGLLERCVSTLPSSGQT